MATTKIKVRGSVTLRAAIPGSFLVLLDDSQFVDLEVDKLGELTRELLVKLERHERPGSVHSDGFEAVRTRSTTGLLDMFFSNSDRYGAAFINHRLNAVDKAKLSMAVADRLPIVIGPETAKDDFIWSLKSEALRRGSMFEFTETNTSLLRTLQSLFSVWVTGEDVAGRPTKQKEDSLAGLSGIVAITTQFRSPRGRLDADKLRELFGLTRSELIKLSNVEISEEAIRTTPDTEKLQPVLEQLERCARLLALLQDRAKFAAWLNTSNPELGGEKPIKVIRDAKIEVIATLVNDILTNRSS